MGLHDALVPFGGGADESPGEFMRRALYAAKEAGGSGRLRLEVGPVFMFGTPESPRDHGGKSVGVSLWVERGTGRTESWQRVTGSVIADTYADALSLFARALDGQES